VQRCTTPPARSRRCRSKAVGTLAPLLCHFRWLSAVARRWHHRLRGHKKSITQRRDVPRCHCRCCSTRWPTVDVCLRTTWRT